MGLNEELPLFGDAGCGAENRRILAWLRTSSSPSLLFVTPICYTLVQARAA